jgi:PAS domain-containing protein
MAEKKKQKTHQKKVKETPKKRTAQLINEITRTEGIINSIGDGLAILDRNFKVLYENQVHRDIMGDHVGEHCYKAYQKREGVCDGCPVALTFKDGNVHILQREVHTDKGTRYLDITASTLRDTTGQIIAGIELVKDITERKQAEEALRESEKHYRETLDAMGDWILAVDQNVRIIIFNEAFEHQWRFFPSCRRAFLMNTNGYSKIKRFLLLRRPQQLEIENLSLSPVRYLYLKMGKL